MNREMHRGHRTPRNTPRQLTHTEDKLTEDKGTRCMLHEKFHLHPRHPRGKKSCEGREHTRSCLSSRLKATNSSKGSVRYLMGDFQKSYKREKLTGIGFNVDSSLLPKVWNIYGLEDTYRRSGECPPLGRWHDAEVRKTSTPGLMSGRLVQRGESGRGVVAGTAPTPVRCHRAHGPHRRRLLLLLLMAMLEVLLQLAVAEAACIGLLLLQVLQVVSLKLRQPGSELVALRGDR